MTIDERMLTGDPLQDSAAHGLGELIESTVLLRRQLVTHEAVCRRILADVQEGMPIGAVLPSVRADSWRSALTGAMKAFESTRHQARLALVAMSVEEGTSIADIARSWGVSRQLASRWVQEAAALFPSADLFASGPLP